ncbi:MAG: LamG-like jellyroll fold domain-containing protein, partial [Pseudomonadota bacterium]
DCYCQPGWCVGGQCCPFGICCTPDCSEKQCGDDGCIGSCGTCDDGNGCTDDSCDELGQCSYVGNSAACASDGNACTDDVCQNGSCQHASISCTDGNACTDDDCDPLAGCTFTPNGNACDDDNACSFGDRCDQGACVGTIDPYCGHPHRDLGEPFGVVVFDEPLPDDCYGGRASFLPVEDLSFSSIQATACLDGEGRITSIDVVARADFGPLGDLELAGRFVDGDWCMSTELSQSSFAGLAGSVFSATAQVCFRSGVATSSVTLTRWHAFPFDSQAFVENVGLKLAPDGAGSFSLSGVHVMPAYYPFANVAGEHPEVRLSDAELRVSGNAGGHWQVVLAGTMQIVAGKMDFPLALQATLASAVVLRLQGTYAGTLFPLGEDEFGFFDVIDPLISVLFDYNARSIEVGLAGEHRIDFLNAVLRAELAGGGRYGEGTQTVFTGPAAIEDELGEHTELQLPGTMPTSDQFCVAAALYDDTEARVCNAEVVAGVGVLIPAQLVRLAASQPDVLLRAVVVGERHLVTRATVPVSSDLIAPGDGIPTIRRLTLSDFFVQEDCQETECTGSIGAHVTFVPDRDPELPILGEATFNRTIAKGYISGQEYFLTVKLLGRWYEPFGLDPLDEDLPSLALEDGTLTVPITQTAVECGQGDPRYMRNCPPLFAQAGRIGVRGTMYFKRSGDWPPEPSRGSGQPYEICDDPGSVDEDRDGGANCGLPSVPGSADDDCLNHLYCVARSAGSNVTAISAGFYLDALPADTGLNIDAPRVVVDLDFGNQELSDLHPLFKLAKMVGLFCKEYGMVFTHIPNAGPAIALAFQALGLSLCNSPTPGECEFPETVESMLGSITPTFKNFRLTISSHDLEIWERYIPLGTFFSATLRQGDNEHALQGSVENGRIAMHAQLDPVHVVLPENASLDILGNANQRVAALTGTSQSKISIGHDSSLNLPEGTIEGWVKRESYLSTESGATLAAKLSGSGTAANGFAIYVGSEQYGRGRVTVLFKNNGRVRRIQTRNGVVAPGRLSHVAVTWKRTVGEKDTAVSILVDGKRTLVSDSMRPGTVQAGSIAPGPSTGPLELGAGFNALDDIRVWKVARSNAQIAAGMRFLQASYVDDNDLVARYELDFDGREGDVAHNTRYHAQNKLHGTFRNSQAQLSAENAAPSLAAVVNLDPAQATYDGLWLSTGARLQLPFASAALSATHQVQQSANQAQASFLIPEINNVELLRLPGIGSFRLNGRGPIDRDDAQFEDGLFGAIDLTSAELRDSADFSFVPEHGEGTSFRVTFVAPCAGGAACTGESPHDLLIAPLLGAGEKLYRLALSAAGRSLATIESASFEVSMSTDDVTRLYFGDNSSLTAAGMTFYGEAELTSERIRMMARTWKTTAKGSPGAIDLDINGVSLPVGELELTLNLASLTLCGHGSASFNNNACDLEVCFVGPPPAGVTGSVTCGGFTVCADDSYCASDETCFMSACVPKFQFDRPCFANSQCASGFCAGLCYEPGKRGRGATCYATPPENPSHCGNDLVCVGAPLGVCLPMVGHGDLCSVNEQCGSGMLCRVATMGDISAPSVCVWEPFSRADNESCSFWFECSSYGCANGRCRCTDSYCHEAHGMDYYCGPIDGRCHEKHDNGANCCLSNECKSDDCFIQGICYLDARGKIRGVGRCYEPHSADIGDSCLAGSDECRAGVCLDGTCRCALEADCPDDKRCNLNLLNGEVGACLDLLGDWSECFLMAADCASGRCGGYLQTPKCYTPHTVDRGNACLVNEHCKSGRCQPDCNWSRCWPNDVADAVARGDFDALADCGCQFKCECNSHDDGGGDKYCSSLSFAGHNFDGIHVCKDRRPWGFGCSSDAQCRSNNCKTNKFGVKHCS